MTDFDLLFSRLRGLAWSHVAMAGACFVFATALFVSPAWGYADFARLQQLLSWFGIVAGSLSLVAAFAMRAGWTLHGVEPAVGLVLLLGGLWTLNFPFSVDTFVPVASFRLVCESVRPDGRFRYVGAFRPRAVPRRLGLRVCVHLALSGCAPCRARLGDRSSPAECFRIVGEFELVGSPLKT